MNRRYFLLIMLLFIPSIAYAWMEAIYKSLDDLIEQAQYVVLAEVSAPNKQYMDCIERRKVTFYYDIKGDAPLHKPIDVLISVADIPDTFNYQSNFCVLFLVKRSDKDAKYGAVSNTRSGSVYIDVDCLICRL